MRRAKGSTLYDIEAVEHPDRLPDDARTFLQAAETRNIGFGVDWYCNLVRTVYPEHPALRFYLLRRDDILVAVLSLRLERAWFGWRGHSLSNYYTTLYEPALADDLKADELVPLLRRLCRDFPRIGSLMLAPMDPAVPAYRVLREALREAHWVGFDYFAFGNWYEPVRQTWPDYLAGRKSNVRSTIKRMSKKFSGDQGVLEVVTLPEDMKKGIAAYEKVYAASWKQPEPYPGFMPGLLQIASEKGMLRLGLAWMNGEPVAAQAWIVGDGRAEIYKVAYDENFKQYSPGTLVTAMLVQYVMEVDQVKEIDYLIGDDPYKKIWMSERRERWGIVAYPLHTLPGLFGLVAESCKRVGKRMHALLRQVSGPTLPNADAN